MNDGSSFPYPKGSPIWDDRDSIYRGRHYWTVETEAGWVGVVADQPGLFPTTGSAAGPVRSSSALAQRDTISAIDRMADTEDAQERVVLATTPTERQIDYAMDLLARLTEQEIFDLEHRIGGRHYRPTADALRQLTRRELSSLIDLLKEIR